MAKTQTPQRPGRVATADDPDDPPPVARSVGEAADPATDKKTPKAAGGAGTIRVRATQTGYYDDARRRPGDVFDLHPRTGMFTVLEEDENGKPLLTDSIPPSRVTREEERTLSAEEQFSKKWMEKVDKHTPTRTTTGNQVIKQQHDEILATRQGAREAPPTGDRNVIGDDD